ncbi:hypothetical protein EVAR_78118_1 [Eumeta japonica]|uniref:Uncharacterized protein n=1 Tax=Eumeta variegata TaxID=151549 RepID=A0A4C1T0H9_EUMVA|nr:hypothetical protein EVAR_78118_1 [Eumeta japonica]
MEDIRPKGLSLTGRKATRGAVALRLCSARLCCLTGRVAHFRAQPTLACTSASRAVLGYAGTEYRQPGRSRSRRDVWSHASRRKSNLTLGRSRYTLIQICA